MKIEIDQSGKIEETNKDTIIAFSNGINYSIRIHRRTKRKLQEDFRKKGIPKLFSMRTFSAGLSILIKDYLNDLDKIIIDTEYYGNEKIIKSMVLDLHSSSKRDKLKSIIEFKRIGKNSPAHILAISISRKKKKADAIISYNKLFKLAIQKSR